MKEREEKKGRLSVDHSVLGADEEQEANLNLTSDQAEEMASPEGQKSKNKEQVIKLKCLLLNGRIICVPWWWWGGSRVVNSEDKYYVAFQR